jgi:prevent-host-death family protein
MGEVVKNLYEAKTELSSLVERAALGEEIIIAKNGKPMARLVALKKKLKRKPGGWEGKVWMSDDFWEPLPADLVRLFEEGPIEPSS